MWRILIGIFVILSLSAQQPSPDPPIADTLFFLPPSKAELLALEQQTATMRASRSLFAADFQGPASSFRISTTQPTFVIRRSGPPDTKFDKLMRLDSVGGKRTMLLTLGPGKTGIPLPGKDAELEYKTTNPNTYLLRPVQPLMPGEYCINFGKSNLAFLFGIEPNATTPETPNVQSRTSQEPPNDRLKTLETLLQKKLITEADYRAKLAEIAAPPGPPTVEDRLRKLDELLKKGLITKPDYQTKRAQLLAEL